MKTNKKLDFLITKQRPKLKLKLLLPKLEASINSLPITENYCDYLEFF